MAAKKARKSKKAPSAKQLAARRKFALAAKARSKAAKKKAVKRPAKKRNSKTIIKAKRVTILNLTKKKNPPRKHNITSASDLAYAGTAKKATQDGVKGWMLGSKFFPGSATTKAQKITASAYLDLRTGDVWKRKAKGNPAIKAGDQVKDAYGKWHTVIRVQGNSIYVSGGTIHKSKVIDVRPSSRKKNVQMMGGGGAFPIRASADYDPSRLSKPENASRAATSAQKARRKATQKKIKAAGGVKRYIRKIKTRKAATRKAGQSRRMTAATKARKATTTRLASRSLDRSGPLKKTRRNPTGYYTVSAINVDTGKRVHYWGYFRSSSKASAIRKAKADVRFWRDLGHSKEKLRGWTATYHGTSDPGVRRNPNTDTKAAYESFQGRASTKSTSLNFPNGTPANVYKLGTLHSITLQSGAVVKPAGKTVWLCADPKGRLHLGTSGERLVNAPKGALGKVKEVEYITTKPHLGDNKPTRYYHELGEETGQKPTLYSDGAGGLVFKGGATYVRSDGIHN